MGEDKDKIPQDYGHFWRWWFWFLFLVSPSIVAFDAWTAAGSIVSHQRLWSIPMNGLALVAMWWGNRPFIHDGVFRLFCIGRPWICGTIRPDTPGFGRMLGWSSSIRVGPAINAVCVTPHGHIQTTIFEKKYSKARSKRIQRVFEHKLHKLSPGSYVEVPTTCDREKRNFRIWFRNSAAAVEFKLRYSDEFDLI